MTEPILKESRVPYNTVLEQPPQSGEVTFLEKNGQPIAAVVSMSPVKKGNSTAETRSSRRERGEIQERTSAFLRALRGVLLGFLQ